MVAPDVIICYQLRACLTAHGIRQWANLVSEWATVRNRRCVGVGHTLPINTPPFIAATGSLGNDDAETSIIALVTPHVLELANVGHVPHHHRGQRPADKRRRAVNQTTLLIHFVQLAWH